MLPRIPQWNGSNVHFQSSRFEAKKRTLTQELQEEEKEVQEEQEQEQEQGQGLEEE